MKTIAKKILDVSSEIGVIQKGGTNQHFNFKFQAWDDVVPAVRDACVKHGLAILPSCELIERVGDRTTIRLTVTLMDVDNDAVMTVNWVGEALDKQDKGVQKAITSAEKYLLLKLFLIPTYGEDPDAHGLGDEPAVPAREPENKGALKDAKSAMQLATGLTGDELKELWGTYAPYLGLVEAAEAVRESGVQGKDAVVEVLNKMMAKVKP